MDAITLLLDGRSKEHWDRSRSRLMQVAFTLPILFFWLFWQPGLINYLVSVAGLLLLVLPVHHLATEVSVLESLRRGRCLDELLTAGVRAESLVDSLPRHALRSLLPRVAGLLPILALSALLLPELERNYLLLGMALWLPLTSVFLVTGSYICQGMILHSRLVAPRAFCLAFPAALLPYEPQAALALGVFFLGLLCWWARLTAIEALLNPPQRALKRTSSWRWPLWSENPIVIREMRKLSQWRVLAWTLCPLLLVGLWPGSSSLVVVSLMALGGAAATTVNALPAEREGKTLDALIQSGIGLREFLRGWVLAVAVPRALALLPLMLALPFFEFRFHPHRVYSHEFWTPCILIAAELAVAVAPWAGAFLGLWAGSLVCERRLARGHLVTGLVAGFGLITALWGGTALGVWGVVHEWLGYNTSWFDDYFLFGFSPMLSIVLGGLLMISGAAAVVKQRMTPLWAGREPVAETSLERALLYGEGALNSLWGPGALCLLPAVCGALGMVWNEFTRFNDELPWAICLFVGIALIGAGTPWLAIWRPATRAWERTGPVAAFFLGALLGTVGSISFVVFLSIAGDIAEEALPPAVIATVISSVLASMRVYARK